MYHNIIFDLGGVVVHYNPKEYLVDRFFHERTERKIYDAVFGSEEWLLMNMGQLSWREASAIFLKRGQEKDIAFEMRTVLEDWTEMLANRRATIVLMGLMKKKGFHLYYLSNIPKEVLALLEQREFWPLFDGGIASCEVGLLKPDINIYKALLDKYKLVPQETIYTDEDKDNTSAAFEAGITGIQFKNVKSFCKMLVTYGIDINAPLAQ